MVTLPRHPRRHAEYPSVPLDQPPLLANLGEVITERLEEPLCGHVHAALELVQRLMATVGLAAFVVIQGVPKTHRRKAVGELDTPLIVFGNIVGQAPRKTSGGTYAEGLPLPLSI